MAARKTGATARAFLALPVALGLAACVTSGSKMAWESIETLSRRSDHVEIPALAYTPLGKGQVLEVDVTDKDPVIRFEGESVYAKAFALPEWTGPYMLKVSSYMIGSPEDPAVYYPTVVFLDAQFRELRRSQLNAFSFRRANFQERNNLNGTLFVNEANRNEVYALVVSQRQAADGSTVVNSLMVQQTPIVVPVGYGTMTWMVPTRSHESSARTAASATGRLKLTVEDYKPVEITD